MPRVDPLSLRSLAVRGNELALDLVDANAKIAKLIEAAELLAMRAYDADDPEWERAICEAFGLPCETPERVDPWAETAAKDRAMEAA